MVRVAIMVRFSENLLGFAICDIYICKNFGDGEGVNECLYISSFLSQ